MSAEARPAANDIFFRLLYLFPDYKDGDWLLVQDPDGTIRIKAWNREAPQPTRKALAAVTQAQITMAHRLNKLGKLISRIEFHRILGNTGGREEAVLMELRREFGDRLLERKMRGR